MGVDRNRTSGKRPIRWGGQQAAFSLTTSGRVGVERLGHTHNRLHVGPRLDDRRVSHRPRRAAVRSNRQARRRSIDDRLKRLAELFEMGDITKAAYVSRKNDLLIERSQLDAHPAAASVTVQRERIESVVDDWAVMTDDERKRVIQMIFVEIRADHTPDGLKVEFKARAAWEPYIEAVLATQGQAPKDLAPVITSVARRGFEPLTSSLKGKRPGPLGDRAARSVQG